MDTFSIFAYVNRNGNLVMSKILKVNRPSVYSSWAGQTDWHPLASVIDYAEVSPIRQSLNDYDIYGIFLHDDEEVIGLKYGCGDYDYKKGTLMCVAYRQTYLISASHTSNHHNLVYHRFLDKSCRPSFWVYQFIHRCYILRRHLEF